MFPLNPFYLPLRGTLRLARVTFQKPPPLPRTAPLRGLFEPPRLLSISVSTFSTRGSLLNTKDPRNNSTHPGSDAKKSGSDHEDPFSTPSVSLESLGIGRNMKLFLLVVFSIFGTIETWVWCKAIWIWWKGQENEE